MFRAPKTHWGLPVDEENAPPSQNKKGMAMILALTVIVIIMGFASDLVINSAVAVELATGIRDRVKAEYMAKSGANLALFLTQLDFGIDIKMIEMNQPPSDGNGDMWSALNGFPIGATTVEMVTTAQEAFDLGKITDSKITDQLKSFDGSFQINVSDEESKINLNFLQNSRRSEVALAMLTGLFSCPAEKALLEVKKLNPKMLASRILDFIDSDSTATEDSGFADENDPYSSYKPPYKARNLPLDSVEDLRLVEGWDDDLQAIFEPYLTVFPFNPIQGVQSSDSKINLNTASRGMLSCLFQEINVDCKEKFALEWSKKLDDKENLTDGKNIGEVLRKTLCYAKREGAPPQDAKEEWFKGNSLTFRIVAEGEVNLQKQKIVMVIRRLDSRAMKERQTNQSWELLYWKLT